MRAFGIDSHQSNQICFAINRKNVMFFICEAQLVAALMTFMLFKAESIFEYGFPSVVILDIILGVAVYINFLLEVKNVSNFIENCETFIGKRKLFSCNRKFLIWLGGYAQF